MDYRTLQAAIIDLDGTMVDTMGDFCEALACMLADLQLPPIERAQVERLVGKGSEHLIRSTLEIVLNTAGAIENRRFTATDLVAKVEELYPPAWASYQRHYLALNGQYAGVYPGVLEGLQRMHSAGLALACLTNKPLAFALPLLRAKGLDGYFRHVFGGDSFAQKKPHPLPLLETCKALGSQPARTLMVGDSSNDALAARAAGCPVVLMTYGYNHGEPVRAVDADGFLDSLSAIQLGS